MKRAYNSEGRSGSIGVRRILIVKPSALGDIVHSLPFLNAVRQRFPDAKIDWVVAHGLHTFLEGHPMINRLWVIKKPFSCSPCYAKHPCSAHEFRCMNDTGVDDVLEMIQGKKR